MFLTKLKSALAMLLVVAVSAGSVVTVASHGVTAQPADAKQDAAKLQDQPEKKDDKKPAASLQLEKKDDAKKSVDPFSFDNLKERLKKHEDDIAKIRQVMLNEIAEEEVKLAAAIKKEQDAQKAGDREAFVRAAKLQAKKGQLNSLRFQIQSGINFRGTPPAPLTAEQRLGLHVSTPGAAIVKQLTLPKNQGMVLDKVDVKSPAAKAGLKDFDILLKIDGKAVPSDKKEFYKILAGIKTDTPVEAIVLREGKEQTVQGLVLPTAAAATAGAK